MRVHSHRWPCDRRRSIFAGNVVRLQDRFGLLLRPSGSLPPRGEESKGAERVEMLPAAGVFHFPWEISSIQDGATVRTYGRLLSYKPEDSEAILSTHHLSAKHDITIHTAFVEPFHPLVGTQYVVLGEVERIEGGGVMVRARVLNCVDGIHLPRLEQAIREQRSYLQEREGEDVTSPPAPCLSSAGGSLTG